MIDKVIKVRNSIRGLFAIGSISLLIILITIVIKYSMLQHAGSLLSIIDPLRVSGREITFIFALCFLACLFCYLTPGINYKFYSYPFAGFSFLYTAALIAQLFLFRITGFGLNREYVHNFLDNSVEVFRMIISVVKLSHLLFLIILLAIFFWLARLPDSRWILSFFRYLKTKKKEYILKGFSCLALCLVILLEASALLPPLESVNPAIKVIPLAELIGGLLADEEIDTKASLDALNLKEEERLDRPIILERDESFKQMNVALIIFESLCWKYCDIYGSDLGVTPFLKELSKRGLIIDRLYTVDPHTTKALIPIIAGIYPYLEPEVLEARPGILPERALPHLLKQIGYRTAFFQTANNYEGRETVVKNLGYDVYKGLYGLPQDGFAYVNFHGREEMMMLNPSLEWIDESRKTPFFITYLTLSSHYEYGYPPDFKARDYRVNDANLNRYLNAVRYTDYFIERLFEEYKRRGLLEKTIFLIVGDHGEAFGEHGLSGHNYSLWEEGLRVAGLVYAPALIKKSGRIEGIRSVLDIVPTVIDLLGLKIKEGDFVGQSMLTPAKEQRELFFSGWSKSKAMALRKGRYKFIYSIWNPIPEIYDNFEDPEDQQNLAGQSEKLLTEAKRERSKLDRWSAVVIAQYKHWEKLRQAKAISRPEDFIYKMSVEFKDLINIYGAGFFPEKREPGRGIWARAGLRVEGKIKKPLRIVIVFKHEKQGLTHSVLLPIRTPWTKLKPGNYAIADSIVSTPEDWPEGKVRVYIGVQDERSLEFLRPNSSSTPCNEQGLIDIGELILFSLE